MAVGGSRETRRFLVDDCNVEVRSDNFAALLTKGDMFPVVNLSLGGVQFIAFRLLTVGQRLKLNIKVGDQFGFVKTAAVVRWVDQIPGERACRVGAGFIKLPDDAAAKLRKMENDYWPRQQDIQEGGLDRLKLPASVARKLSFMIDRGHEARPDHETVLLMRKGFKTPKMGDISDLTQQQVGYGRWVDGQRGLIFKNPEESFGDRMAEAHSKDGPADQSALDPASAEPPAGAPPTDAASPQEDAGPAAPADAPETLATPVAPAVAGLPDSPAPGLELVAAETDAPAVPTAPVPTPSGAVDLPPTGPEPVSPPVAEPPISVPDEPAEGLPADLDVVPASVDAPPPEPEPIPVQVDSAPISAPPELVEAPPAEPEGLPAGIDGPPIPASPEAVAELPPELDVIPAEVDKTPLPLASVPADTVESEPIPAEIDESSASGLVPPSDLEPPDLAVAPEAVELPPSEEAEPQSVGEHTPLPAAAGATPAPEPAPPPAREAGGHGLHPIPVYLLGGGHELSVDEEGLPSGACASALSLPNFGVGHFAVRVVDTSMASANGKSFRLGDIVVFSTERTASNEAYALVATKEGPLFRQVFYEPESRVTLHPLHPDHSDAELDPDDIVAMWPSVAHICWK